jgi:murein hydrolase activator
MRALQLLISLTLLMFSAGSMAQVAAISDPAATLAQERAALGRAQAQAREAKARSAMLEARAAAAVREADQARDRAAAMAARVQESEANLRASQARVAIIAQAQAAQARRLAVQQQPVVRLTAALQQIARRPPIVAMLQPGSVSDAVHRRIILARMLPMVAQRTEGLRNEIARSARLRTDADAAARALGSTRDQLNNQRAQLAQLEQQRRLASRALRLDATVEQERALAMGEQAQDIGALMEQIEDAAKVKDALIALPGPSLRPALPGGAALPTSGLSPAAMPQAPAMRLPVVGEVVAGFGERSESGIRARGLTIATTANATVTAPAAGRVAYAGPFRGFGSILIIDHGAGWTSLITDLARLDAQVGDSLRQGDPVGAAGTNRPRITIELRRQNQPVDIASLLR